MERGLIRSLSTLLLLLITHSLLSQTTRVAPNEWLSIISDTCIYDDNNHSAFTSLIERNGVYYVAFREAGSHMPMTTDNGNIRVLVGNNNKWSTNHVFSVVGVDLRDPCFVQWKNKVLLYTTGFYSELTDTGWSDLKNIHHNAPHPICIWKIRPYKDELYGIGHSWNNWPLLMKSKDGIEWEVVDEYILGGNATEADLLFENNYLFICFRVEYPDGAHSMWGVSSFPFTKTNFTEMSVSVASPDLIKLSNNTILLSGRETIFDRESRQNERSVSLFAIDKKGIVKNHLVVSRAEDQGYCSFCKIGKKHFLMTYYTGTESKSSIRLISFKVE